MAFAEKIYALRKERGWSQEKLSEQLGVSRQTVSKWELGAAMPELTKLKQISELFSVTLDDLINEKELPCVDRKIHEKNIGIAETALNKDDEDKKRKSSPGVIVLCLTVAAAFIVLLCLLLPNNNKYIDAQSIYKYLNQNINLNQPYATIDLSSLDPDSVRIQMENDGKIVDANDSVLNEGISLFINDYFSQFEDYGIVYDVEKRQLYYNERPVSYFDDCDASGILTQIFWYSNFENGVMLTVERNSRGIVTSAEDYSVYSE